MTCVFFTFIINNIQIMLKKAHSFLRQPILNNKLLTRKETVTLDGQSLNLENLSLLGSGKGHIEVAEQSWAKLAEARKIVDAIS